MLKTKLITLLSLLAFTTYTYAEDKVATKSSADHPTAKHDVNEAEAGLPDDKAASFKEKAEYQKIADEYKKYLLTVKTEVREEVVTYRKAIAKINKQKRDIYKSLSQEAQLYLAKEREVKRKLPLDDKTAITDKDMVTENNENKMER